jgi:cytochrome P450
MGSAPEFQKEPLEFLGGLTAEYGDIAGFRFGPFPACYVNHPDFIHQVLVADASKFQKSRIFKKIIAKYLGNGLVNNDGESWRQQRKLITPAFHYSRIQSYAETMVDYTARMMNDWAACEIHDIDLDMTRLTLNIVSKTLFDANVDDSASRVHSAMKSFQEIVGREVKSPSLLPDWLPTKSNRERKAIIATLDEVVMGIINERRVTEEDRGDLLSMLLMARYEDGGGMSDKQVRDEVMTLFLAGHETTATTLMWTLYALSEHPEVEARLMEELDRVLEGRAPTVQDLGQLEYTEMVIKESMRMYPPAWQTSREALEDVTIGGYTVAKGTMVILSPYTTHHDARWWDEPEAFRPERFAKGQEDRVPRYAYWPFGGGPRVCIGVTFSMMEARLVLATMLQQYQFSLKPGFPVEVMPQATLKSKFGLEMYATAREAMRVAGC